MKRCSTCHHTFTPDRTHRLQCEDCQRKARERRAAEDASLNAASQTPTSDFESFPPPIFDASPSYDPPAYDPPSIPDSPPPDFGGSDSGFGGGGADGSW